MTDTEKNTVISTDFLVWKFCGKAQFPQSFGRFARNYAETVPFRKISTPENQVKLRYFSQCEIELKHPEENFLPKFLNKVVLDFK